MKTWRLQEKKVWPVKFFYLFLLLFKKKKTYTSIHNKYHQTVILETTNSAGEYSFKAREKFM